VSGSTQASPESKLATALRAAQAIARRDLDALAELLAPDCEIVPLRAAVDHTVFRGPHALTEWWAAQDDAWEGMAWEEESSREGPDWVLGLGRLRARSRGSGVPLDVPAAFVIRFRDKRITRIQVYTNRGDALAELGLEREADAG
jgi:ketosteroid isomerase-like protein